MRTPDGEEGLNYLCPAYKRFFRHIDPKMKDMAVLLRGGRPAAEVMRPAVAPLLRPAAGAGGKAPGRNDPCPCGSGRKFKKCCGSIG
jgi:uncharacterized protein